MTIAVVGGGIVGIAIARELQRKKNVKVTLIEKESRIASHQSSRNSGVMHAGLYYKPGSLKAQMSRRGIKYMKAYCTEKRIPFEACGKIVVATNEAELKSLEDLYTRGVQNNLIGLKKLTRAQAQDIEPYVNCCEALHVPEESIVSYNLVARSLYNDFLQAGGESLLSSKVTHVDNKATSTTLTINNSCTQTFDAVVCCGGLFSDKLAEMSGQKTDNSKIIPFRGEYFKLKPEYTSLVKGLIYPVPNPNFPFLGVHLTKMIDGTIEAGPNAVLALAREGYQWTDINLTELFETLTYPGLAKFIQKYPLPVLGEVMRSLSKNLFVKSLQALIPDLTSSMLEYSPSGVRAQLVNIDGVLEQDFRILFNNNIVTVLNAPSPAATSSLAIAEHVVQYI